ncbi:MAG: 3'-5' exonuclease, partial [Gammaproteobacteria bacterium]
MQPFFNRDEGAEADMVLQLIRKTREEKPEGKIAVLVRNRKHLADILPVLNEAGIPFRAVEIEGLGQRPAIRDLMALTLALHHCADRIAWLACLRAPWCGLRLSDLLVLAGGDKTRTIWECLQDEIILQNLSREGRRCLEKPRAVLAGYFSGQRRRSLRRSVESVWISLGGPATIANETDLENANTYLDLLDQFDRGGALRDRERFIEGVEKLFAAPAATDDRLQIMTMHKAKGLEFDTVILPGLDRGSRAEEIQLLLWTEHPHGQHQDLLLAPVKEAGEEKSPVYEFVKRLEKEKQQYELGRLLYVACTRAERKLYLLATMEVNSKGEL